MKQVWKVWSRDHSRDWLELCAGSSYRDALQQLLKRVALMCKLHRVFSFTETGPDEFMVSWIRNDGVQQDLFYRVTEEAK